MSGSSTQPITLIARRLHLERLALGRRGHDRSGRLDGAAGGELQDLVGVVGQRVGRDHLHRMEHDPSERWTNEMPALESRRVRTQPLTVTGASAGASPARMARTSNAVWVMDRDWQSGRDPVQRRQPAPAHVRGGKRREDRGKCNRREVASHGAGRTGKGREGKSGVRGPPAGPTAWRFWPGVLSPGRIPVTPDPPCELHDPDVIRRRGARGQSVFRLSGRDRSRSRRSGIARELARQRDEIELIASENIVSRAVLEAQGSVPHQQVCRGPAGAALLRRLPVGRCGGKPGNRTGYEAFRM